MACSQESKFLLEATFRGRRFARPLRGTSLSFGQFAPIAPDGMKPWSIHGSAYPCPDGLWLPCLVSSWDQPE